MRRLAVLCLCLACTPAAAQEVDPDSLFARAGASYDAGQFTLAAERYDSLLAAGYNSAAVYFNLGNSFFRAGYLGHAIWAYRNAAQLSPRDHDIETNLTVARLAARDRIEEGSVNLLQQIWRTASKLLSLSEGASLVTTLWLVVWVAMAFALTWPTSRRFAVPVVKVAGSFWLLALVVLSVRFLASHNTTQAVVIAEETHALSAPDAEQDVVFSGHAGLECAVRGQRDSYLLVELANGRVGWLPAVDLKLIDS